MERTDWMDGGFDAVEARFLMVTAITHHQFSSPIWGEDEVASSTPNWPRSTSWPARPLRIATRPRLIYTAWMPRSRRSSDMGGASTTKGSGAGVASVTEVRFCCPPQPALAT